MKRRADGRFQKRITLPDGKSKFLYSSAKSEREAIKDFNRQMLTLDAERRASKNFDKVAEAWAEERFQTVQHNTVKQYIPCKKEAVSFFGDIQIADIPPMKIRAYLDFLACKGLAKKTIKERYAVLKQIFNYAQSMEWIERNPCLTVRLKTPQSAITPKRDAATPKEVAAIKNASNDIPFVFFAKFLLFTGCRRGEALALQPTDIDFEKRTVSVTKTVEWVGNFPHIKNAPKTEAGEREIPLPDILIDELVKRKSNNYIFQGDTGGVMKNSEVTRKWKALQKELGIQCTPHQLRHSYATMLFDAGIDVKTAQRWLGHADIKTTLDTYTHLSDLRQTESVGKWVDFIDKVVKK